MTAVYTHENTEIATNYTHVDEFGCKEW